jgi:uncharacterized protein YndB with AHSA1/START domain
MKRSTFTPQQIALALRQAEQLPPPDRLLFTWSWEIGAARKDTLVTLEFVGRGGSTEVGLRREFLPSEEVRAGHQNG